MEGAGSDDEADSGAPERAPSPAEKAADLFHDPEFKREVLGEVEKLLRGDAVDRFEIHELVGQGGMGIVHRATDTRVGRAVALKRIRPELRALSAVRDRFAREGAAASRLDHRHICQVYEVGAEPDPYIVMPFLSGSTLRAKIEAARSHGEPILPVASSASEFSAASSELLRRLELCEKIARALAYAHRQGFVHRDVKPSNIMIQPDGEPVIMDFGLVLDTTEAGEPSRSRSSGEPGTWLYMSPEQISPRGRKPDGRSDIFSLGVACYECVTLRHPFADGGERHEVETRILDATPTPPHRLAAVPRELSIVLGRALQKDPARRFETMAQFADELRRIRLREPIETLPPGPLTRTWLWTRRNPVLTALIFALSLGLTTALLQRRSLLIAGASSEYQRALLHISRCEYDSALSALAAAESLGHDEVLVGIARTDIYEAQGRRAAAVRGLHLLLSRHEPPHLGRLKLLDADLDTNQLAAPHEKVEQIELALASGDLTPVEQHYAKALLAPGSAAALVCLERARVEDPFDRRTNLLYLQLLLIGGRVSDAERFLGWLGVQYAADPDIQLIRAWLALRHGDRFLAATCFDRVASIGERGADWRAMVEGSIRIVNAFNDIVVREFVEPDLGSVPYAMLTIELLQLGRVTGRLVGQERTIRDDKQPRLLLRWIPSIGAALVDSAEDAGRSLVTMLRPFPDPTGLRDALIRLRDTIGDGVFSFALGRLESLQARFAEACAHFEAAERCESLLVSREALLFSLLAAQRRLADGLDDEQRRTVLGSHRATLERLRDVVADRPARLRYLHEQACWSRSTDLAALFAQRWLAAAPRDAAARAACQTLFRDSDVAPREASERKDKTPEGGR